MSFTAVSKVIIKSVSISMLASAMFFKAGLGSAICSAPDS